MTLTPSNPRLITEAQPVVTEAEMIEAVNTLLLGLGENPERDSKIPLNV